MVLLFLKPAYAQLMRVGPFDLNAQTELAGEYSSNIEQQYPDQVTLSPEDYYVTAALDVNGIARLGQKVKANLDTGVALEKHFKRPDLDNQNNPLGKAALSAEIPYRHSQIGADISIEKKSQADSSTYIPGQTKNSTTYTEFTYGFDWGWSWQALTLDAGYDYNQKRYQKEEMRTGDEDRTTIVLGAEWKLLRRLSLNYDGEFKKDVFPRQAATPDKPVWGRKHYIYADVEILPLKQEHKRPTLDVAAGFEQDTEQDDEYDPEWEPKYTVDLGFGPPMELFGNKNLTLTLDVTYTYKKRRVTTNNKEEPDEIKFTYGGTLKHEISHSARQTLTVMQQPINTFGSTEKTEQTQVGYSFVKENLFIYNLDMDIHLGWEQDKPLGTDDAAPGPEERKWLADFILTHRRALTRKLHRELSYEFHYEQSNLHDKPMEENRLVLAFIYDL